MTFSEIYKVNCKRQLFYQGIECRSSGGQLYKQVWPWLVAAPAHRATLARCTWESRKQVERHDVQLHALTSSTVPDEFLPSDLQRRITVTDPIYQPTTSSWATLPAKHHRPTGFLCGWSVVEFFARLLARFWCWRRRIQTTFENVYVRYVLAYTAHWRFYVYALYKFTLTLNLNEFIRLIE